MFQFNDLGRLDLSTLFNLENSCKCTVLQNACVQVDPKEGTVGFGSGLHGWAFTLKDFAKIYTNKFKIEESQLMKRLWGDQFYHTKDKKWYKEARDGAMRGFTQYILKPIYQVSLTCLQRNFFVSRVKLH